MKNFLVTKSKKLLNEMMGNLWLIQKIRNRSIFLPLLMVIGILLLILLWPKPKKAVPIESVTSGEIVQTISITGTVLSEKSADLTFQLAGTLATLNVEKGDNVTKNQVIATLDQRTTLKNLKAALLNYSLQRNTYEQTALNQQAYKPKDALNDAMRRVLENNQYNLDLAVNSVEIQELAREKSILTTPISGIVTRADVKTSGVNIGVTTTFTVVDPSSLTFRMEVDEADISKIKLGQNVEIILNSYPERTIKVIVTSIDFVAHTTSTGGNAFDVKAKIIEEEAFPLRIGMNGNATINTSTKQNVIKIPIVSLIDNNTVYVKEKNKYVKRKIKLGLQSDTETEVLQGLSIGDQIVTDPNAVTKK